MAKKASVKAELSMDTSRWSSSLKKSKAETDVWAKSINSVKASPLIADPPSFNRWTEMVSKIQLASMAMKGFSTAASVVKSSFVSEASFEKIIQQLSATADGTETLREELTALMEVAKMPGLGFREAIQGAAAFKSIGLNAKEARDALVQYGNALTNAGRGKADLEAVIASLEQISAGGMVDEGNLKEISRRIRGFREITAGLDRGKPIDWIKGTVDRLKDIPRAAESAQDKLENLRDAVDQKRLGLTGGKVAGIAGSVLGEIGNFVSGRGFNAGEIVDAAGEGDVISKYEPKAAELARRESARASAKASGDEERLRAAEKYFDIERESLDLAYELAKAEAAGNKELVAQLEERKFLMATTAKLAKELGVSEDFVKQKLEGQLFLQRQIKEAAQPGQRDAMKRNAEIERLRSRGRNRGADKMESEDRRKENIKSAVEAGFSPQDAAKMADDSERVREDAAFRDRTGRNRIHGGVSRNTGSGLDEFSRFRDSAMRPFTPALDEYRQRRNQRMSPPSFPALNSIPRGGSVNPRKPAAQGGNDAIPAAVVGRINELIQTVREGNAKLDSIGKNTVGPVADRLKPAA